DDPRSGPFGATGQNSANSGIAAVTRSILRLSDGQVGSSGSDPAKFIDFNDLAPGNYSITVRVTDGAPDRPNDHQTTFRQFTVQIKDDDLGKPSLTVSNSPISYITTYEASDASGVSVQLFVIKDGVVSQTVQLPSKTTSDPARGSFNRSDYFNRSE